VTTPAWQEAWNLRIDVLDIEHRELMEILNALDERFTSHPGGQDQVMGEADGLCQEAMDEREVSVEHTVLIAALDRLGERARDHFQHEEAFMRSIDYPDLGAHRCEHALLHAEYVEMVRNLKHQPITQLDPETVTALRRWLVGHMLAADKEYANYYFAWLEQQEEHAR